MGELAVLAWCWPGAGLSQPACLPSHPERARSLPATRGVWGPFSRQVRGVGIGPNLHVPGSSGQGEARLRVWDPDPGPSPLRVPRALGVWWWLRLSPQEN